MNHYTVQLTLDTVSCPTHSHVQDCCTDKTFNNRLEHKSIVLSRGLGPGEKLMEQDTSQRVPAMLQPPTASR